VKPPKTQPPPVSKPPKTQPPPVQPPQVKPPKTQPTLINNPGSSGGSGKPGGPKGRQGSNMESTVTTPIQLPATPCPPGWEFVNDGYGPSCWSSGGTLAVPVQAWEMYERQLDRTFAAGAARYADWLLNNRSLTDLERLAMLSDFVARRYPDDQQAYLSLMTRIIMGVDSSPLSPLAAVTNGDKCSGWGRDPGDCPENEITGLFLLDSGFHSDYQDKNNQVFHFWASVDAVGGASSETGMLARNALVFIGLQVFHEGIQGVLIGTPLGDPGSSWEDYALTDRGMLIGTGLAMEYFQPSEVGDRIRNMLSQPWPGDIDALYQIFPLPGPSDE
jgi:hypothetical protein